MPLSTAEAVRDRAYALIEALAPSTDSRTRFRRFRNEEGADFEEWAEQNPTASFRRFQVREDDDDPNPEVSNTTEERVRVRYRISIAYPQTHRYGNQNAMDRHDVMNQDYVKVRHAIGIDGRANFTTSDAGSYDATPLGATKTREQGGKVDYLVIVAEFEFVRSTVLTTTLSAALSDSDDPLTANGGAFTYTLVVTNTGNLPANSIRAVVTLPTGVGYTSATGTGWTITNSGQLVSCAMASGQPGALATIIINCTAPNDVGAGSMTASVSVNSTNVETTATDSETTTLYPSSIYSSHILMIGQSNINALGAQSSKTDKGLTLNQAQPGITANEKIGAARADPISFTLVATGTLAPYGATGMGPELSFGPYALRTRGGAPFISKFCCGGTYITDWMEGSGWPTSPSEMWTQLTDYVDARITETNHALDGVLLALGNSDATDTTRADAYAGNLSAFVSALRARYGNFKLAIEQMSINCTGGSVNPTARDTVRAAQAAYVAANPTNTVLIDCDDLPIATDNVHYDSDGTTVFGNRSAEALLSLIDPSAGSDAGSGPAPWLQAADLPMVETNTGAALTPYLPNHEAGDIIVVAITTTGADTSPTLTTANGFAILDAPVRSADGTAGTFEYLTIYTKTAASSSESPPVVTPGAGSNYAGGLAFVVRGSSGVDVTATGANNTTAKPFTATGPTTRFDNELVVHVLAANTSSTLTVINSWTAPNLAGFAIDRDTRRPNPIIGPVTYTMIGLAHGTLAAAGATGTLSGAYNVNSISSSMVIAFKP